jgi:hypothetical protein
VALWILAGKPARSADDLLSVSQGSRISRFKETAGPQIALTANSSISHRKVV